MANLAQAMATAVGLFGETAQQCANSGHGDR